MTAPIEPDDPDVRVHAAWLAQVSDAADGLVARQVPKQDDGSTSVSAISSNPAVRLVGHDAPPPQLPRLCAEVGNMVLLESDAPRCFHSISGSLATFASFTILPRPYTTQTLESSKETSIPA